MTISYTSSFHRSFTKLTATQQGQIEKAIRRFCQSPLSPFPRGWRVHKLEGKKGTALTPGSRTPDVWEMHAPGKGALVVTFQYEPDGVMFRNCGNHDETIRDA